ncbi:acyltransferase family protein [Chromobacterium subtsugae]|uniref:acyltransferase family protein n=1 Tax=Chromobacterium subtsugae TaxID=251747 RepID=UPI001AD81ACD|nr:acyltransferase [Chromobacterium subtsugae]
MTYLQSPNGPAPRLPSLTGMRFVAAALVFLFHASLLAAVKFNPYQDSGAAQLFQSIFSKAGWLGVSFFFVLSGFVMTWSARADDSAGGFIRRRLLKIYPNHFFTWLLMMVCMGNVFVDPRVWLSNLLLLQSWVPRPEVFMGVNSPSWSLCCELLFYLAFPWLNQRIARIPAGRLWPCAAAAVLALFAVQLAVDSWVPATPKGPGLPISLQQWWLSYFFPPLRMFEFVLGMLMARILRAGKWPDLGLLPAAGLLLGGYLLAREVPFLYGLSTATVIPVALLITAAAAADAQRRPTGFNGRRMVWLGEVSFAFYMVHMLVLDLASAWLDGRRFEPAAATLVVLAAFLASLLAGWLLYALVERPVMRYWSRPRAAAVRLQSADA